MIIDIIANWKNYKLPENFSTAFEHFLVKLDRAYPTGRIDILGDKLFANVDEYDTIDQIDAPAEMHKRYADIQILLSGREYINCYRPSLHLPIRSPYNDEKDYAFYETAGYPPLTTIEMDIHVFAIFMPGELHAPKISIAGSQQVKKIVYKIAI